MEAFGSFRCHSCVLMVTPHRLSLTMYFDITHVYFLASDPCFLTWVGTLWSPVSQHHLSPTPLPLALQRVPPKPQGGLTASCSSSGLAPSEMHCRAGACQASHLAFAHLKITANVCKSNAPREFTPAAQHTSDGPCSGSLGCVFLPLGISSRAFSCLGRIFPSHSHFLHLPWRRSSTPTPDPNHP